MGDMGGGRGGEIPKVIFLLFGWGGQSHGFLEVIQ